jgi:hypothetical protein
MLLITGNLRGKGGSQGRAKHAAQRAKRLDGRLSREYLESSHDQLWMIATSILPQVCHWNQHPAADSPSRQFVVGNQVIEPALADRE